MDINISPVEDKDAGKSINKNAIMASLALIIFVDMMGIGLILPILPKLISSLSDVSIGRAAEIGGLSDRFSRRPVLLITLTALGLDYILMAIAPTLLWLFVGRIISGIMGATWSAANSCIADMFNPKDRGANFGKLGAAGGAGLVMRPAIGGLLGGYGERIPFYVASILCLLGAIFAFLVFKETLSSEKRRIFEIKRANPLGNLIYMLKKPFIIGALACIFFIHVASQSEIAVWAFYLIEKFAWSEFQIGLSVTLFGILLAIVQGGLVGPAINRFGEAKTVIYSLLFGVPAYIIFANAGYGWVMIVGICVGALGGFAFPAIQSMMSSCIEKMRKVNCKALSPVL